jgi:hypothetical protein
MGASRNISAAGFNLVLPMLCGSTLKSVDL